MAAISASMVKELRETTGLGMMECKKALEEASGDLKKAEELLRIKSGAKASKAASRIAAEGVIGQHVGADGKLAAMIEVNCETDFVARNPEFLAFAKALAAAVANENPADVNALSQLSLNGTDVESARQALVQKIGENMSIRRFVRVTALGRIASYVHGTRIGVLVDVTGGDEVLGKDVAMHIAASKPLALSREQISPDVIQRERDIATARAAESGKPANIVDKMVEGTIGKFLAENTLLGQKFVKNEDLTIDKLLASKGAKVNAFHLFVVGEGIERKKDDFAAEVAAMTRG